MSANDGVLVALSGGVDSAVALLRLAATGRHVEAAIVKLWPGDDPRSCCGPTAIARAQAVAGAFGVRLHVLDQQARFARTVVEPFVAAYLAGETPNPCVACNPERLAALVGLADELGLARVATGHYARLVTRDGESWPAGVGEDDGEDAGEPYLARAVDRAKDQSYMLAAVPAALLARLEFPLGGLTKPEVRAAAREAGLAAADEPESQEVCFALEGYQDVPRGARREGAEGADRRPPRPRARGARGPLALHDRPAPRPRRVGRRAALRARAPRGGERDRRRRRRRPRRRRGRRARNRDRIGVDAPSRARLHPRRAVAPAGRVRDAGMPADGAAPLPLRRRPSRRCPSSRRCLRGPPGAASCSCAWRRPSPRRHPVRSRSSTAPRPSSAQA